MEQARVFADSKTFADAVPRQAPAVILADWRAQRDRSPAALKEFVRLHFDQPAAAATVAPPAAASLSGHIDALWDQLTRRTPDVPAYGSLLRLPLPYVVPGGRFREVYYWDSYFTMLGLRASGRDALAAGMVGNFAYLIDRYGHVPNGTRSYYLSRSQPPFFYAMVTMLDGASAGAAVRRYLPELRREYAFWMQGQSDLRTGGARRRVVRMPDGSVLNRYWDDQATARDESYREDTELARHASRPAAALYRDLRAAAESGWDFSSRRLADGRTLASIDTTDVVPVDLNSLLYGLERAIQSGCATVGDARCARVFALRSSRRQRAIARYLWDPTARHFVDFDWRQRRQRPALTAATFYPLFTGVASALQAAAVVQTARTLLAPGGLATSSVSTGQQWDAPNGWAPLQWIAVAGLRRYGNTALAADIACRWLHTVGELYDVEGRLVEKYDLTATGQRGGGGEYPTQDGFGWTNGVTRALLALYQLPAAPSDAGRCVGDLMRAEPQPPAIAATEPTARTAAE